MEKELSVILLRHFEKRLADLRKLYIEKLEVGTMHAADIKRELNKLESTLEKYATAMFGEAEIISERIN